MLDGHGYQNAYYEFLGQERHIADVFSEIILKQCLINGMQSDAICNFNRPRVERRSLSTFAENHSLYVLQVLFFRRIRVPGYVELKNAYDCWLLKLGW